MLHNTFSSIRKETWENGCVFVFLWMFRFMVGLALIITELIVRERMNFNWSMHQRFEHLKITCSCRGIILLINADYISQVLVISNLTSFYFNRQVFNDGIFRRKSYYAIVDTLLFAKLTLWLSTWSQFYIWDFKHKNCFAKSLTVFKKITCLTNRKRIFMYLVLKIYFIQVIPIGLSIGSSTANFKIY